MEKLLVISADKNSATATMQMKYGMSSSQFIVLSNLEEVNSMLGTIYDGIAVFIRPHSTESIKIREVLSSRQWLFFNEEEKLEEFMKEMKNKIQELNYIHKNHFESSAQSSGEVSLLNFLSQKGMTKETGFSFRVGRDPQRRFFYTIPESNRATVIHNILAGYLRNS